MDLPAQLAPAAATVPAGPAHALDGMGRGMEMGRRGFAASYTSTRTALPAETMPFSKKMSAQSRGAHSGDWEQGGARLVAGILRKKWVVGNVGFSACVSPGVPGGALKAGQPGKVWAYLAKKRQKHQLPGRSIGWSPSQHIVMGRPH